VVVDPVMVSESGSRLLDEDAVGALRERVLPLAAVVTPNLPEARILAGGAAGPDAGPEALARAIHALGPRAVVVTGGHRDEHATDVFFDGRSLEEIPGPRHPEGAAHGSGCTHSSTLAAMLALGHSPLEAAKRARAAAASAVEHGLRDIGRGPGPVDVLRIGAKRGLA
jgi:hydroxymethylpyrimidine/phosphomethylpyrimidine kinase